MFFVNASIQCWGSGWSYILKVFRGRSNNCTNCICIYILYIYAASVYNIYIYNYVYVYIYIIRQFWSENMSQFPCLTFSCNTSLFKFESMRLSGEKRWNTALFYLAEVVFTSAAVHFCLIRSCGGWQQMVNELRAPGDQRRIMAIVRKSKACPFPWVFRRNSHGKNKDIQPLLGWLPRHPTSTSPSFVVTGVVSWLSLTSSHVLIPG